MRATNTFQALCLGATLGLTGCVTVEHEPDYGRYESYDDRDYGPPPHAPAHGYRHHSYGFDHIYDGHLGVYSVVGFPNVWFHDGWYYRHNSRGYWERCNRPRGASWGRSDWAHVPQRLRPRYGDYHPNGNDRWDRREERQDNRDERVEDRRDERSEDRHERVEQRHDDRDQRVDARHDQRDERKVERHERVEQRHDVRDDRTEQRHDARGEQKVERQERVEQRHEVRDARVEQRHDQRDDRKAVRTDRKEERHEARAERGENRREERADKAAGRKRGEYAGPVE